jgi:hypothetical protein
MPFTFAHPAIVIPLARLKKTRLSATGLITGSLAPDFESFLKLGGEKIYGHTWLGMFWFDMPLALMLAVVFHTIVRGPLMDNLPVFISSRLAPWRNVSFLVSVRKNATMVLLSLFTGILSHLIWDAVTHLNFSYPDAVTSRLMIGHRRVYILLQYASSVAGLIYIAGLLARLPRHPLQKTAFKTLMFWPLFIGITVGIAVPVLLQQIDFRAWIDKIYIINVLISAATIALIITSAMVRYALINRRN